MKNKLLMYYPASCWKALWRDALPTGNGTIGAAVYGAVANETVMLTHEALWHKQITQQLPDVSDRLPEIRRHLMNNEAQKSQTILVDALRGKEYKPSLGEPLPLADLQISQKADHGFREYSRTLDMETGEVSVAWQDGKTIYQRDLFVSRTEDIVACKLSAKGPGAISAGITLHLHDVADGLYSIGESGERILKSAETKADGDYIYFAAGNDDGTDFGAVARVCSTGNCTTENDSKNSENSIVIQEATSVLILIRVFVKGSRTRDWKRCKRELSAHGTSYQELFRRHAITHRKLFDAMSLDLRGNEHEKSNEELLLSAYRGEAPTALIEKMWAFGRHLLISSSREGGLPCPLQGLWTGEWNTFWAFNMANENLQMIYWQALQGNIPETLLAVFDYHDDMLEDFKSNARMLYGCRGIFIPAPTTPGSGLLKTLKPHIIHWTGGAAWVAQHYYDYYLFTGDEEFLRQRALPFMKEAALFYQDFFTVGDDGYLISSPSISPENTPGVSDSETGVSPPVATTMNATMDFALAKEVITNLIAGSRKTGMYKEEIPGWKDMLGKIPPYQVNEDGAVREWMHPFFPDNYGHRHESHIYPVFPGTELIKEDDPKLFQAFVTAVKKRLIIGLKDQSGWSLVHMANAYARMGEGNLALEALELLCRSCVINNLFTYHNDWRRMGICLESFPPFQIDANMGWTSAVQEMLLFSRPGMIKFLPALPEKWSCGEFNRMLCRGEIVVSAAWDLGKRFLKVSILSHIDQTVTLKFPCLPEKIQLSTPDMQDVIQPGFTDSHYGEQYRNIDLLAGLKVEIEINFKHISNQ